MTGAELGKLVSTAADYLNYSHAPSNYYFFWEATAAKCY